ncbi:MAG: cupin domain-containing protein [Fibrella sp.]|nr:cupin domain-containing protein [Armatimonadota bacterium]
MNPVAQSPLFVRAGAGHFADLGDHRAHIRVSADHTEGVFMLVEIDADFNAGVPPHVHRIEDETFVVLSGQIEFGIGEQTVEAGPGDTVFAPRNIAHTWRCTSAEGAKVLIWFTPGDNFQSFGLAMAAQGVVPQEAMADPVLAAKFMALTAKHGIEMLLPGK